jgi:hypothetical protein
VEMKAYEEAIAICSMFEDRNIVGEDRAMLAEIDRKAAP